MLNSHPFLGARWCPSLFAKLWFITFYNSTFTRGTALQSWTHDFPLYSTIPLRYSYEIISHNRLTLAIINELAITRKKKSILLVKSPFYPIVLTIIYHGYFTQFHLSVPPTFWCRSPWVATKRKNWWRLWRSSWHLASLGHAGETVIGAHSWW